MVRHARCSLQPTFGPCSVGDEMNKKMRFHVGYFFVALMGVILLHDAWVTYRSVETIPYSEFEQFLRDGKVSEVVVSDQLIEGVLKTPDNGKTRFATTRVPTDLGGEL